MLQSGCPHGPGAGRSASKLTQVVVLFSQAVVDLRASGLCWLLAEGLPLLLNPMSLPQRELTIWLWASSE